ncbi:MAG TPA: YcxB family protein [Mucilaginibacter sp.]|nr:YcxB family protein [Mucilaginibacter sp.]
MMELIFKLSKKDYLKFCKLHLKDSISRHFVRFLLLAVFLVIILNAESFDLLKFLTSLVLVPAILFTILYFIPLFIFYRRLIKKIKNTPAYLSEKRLILGDEGLFTANGDKMDIWKWQAMKSIYSNQEFVYLILIDKRYIVIPKRCFESENAAVNFYGLVSQKIFWSGRNSATHDFNEAIKPNYWWGLFGLIPAFGAVAGLIFIVNGISRFKNIRYTLMGLACVVFNVIVLYMINLNLNPDHIFRRQFLFSSKYQLNQLLKNVEFYKLEYGTYPDNLSQLKKDDPTISDFDPIQSSSNKYGVGFNYQKVGDHYYLFSSGFDGIPNTKDDFYPDVAVSDSMKFGLLIKSHPNR